MQRASRLLMGIEETEYVLREHYGVDDSFIDEWKRSITVRHEVERVKIDRDAVLSQNDGNCVYCGKPANSIDHVIPKKLGGGDNPENLVPACMDCNRRKKDKADWRP